MEKQGVKILDTPEDYYPAYMKATHQILEKYAKKDPFFKKVLTSMQEFAKVVVPYQEKVNGLYFKMGKAAIDEGVVGYGD